MWGAVISRGRKGEGFGAVSKDIDDPSSLVVGCWDKNDELIPWFMAVGGSWV